MTLDLSVRGSGGAYIDSRSRSGAVGGTCAALKTCRLPKDDRSEHVLMSAADVLVDCNLIL